MNFAEAIKKEETVTFTENGEKALNTTSDSLVDLFGTIGALRGADEVRITTLFSEAYDEDPLVATKMLFYARDIRGGLGERNTFRTILRWLADHHPEAVKPNLDLIGVFGRYDDLYFLIGTSLEDNMWKSMRIQFNEDIENLAKNNAVSLLGKWIKTADASSKNTRKLGILTAIKLGYKDNIALYKRLVRGLRRQINVVEGLMSENRWNEINYSTVPSRAMKLYTNAFLRHDESRYKEYLESVEKGKAKINSSTLYPYDIIKPYIRGHEEDKTAELQWKALPDYVEEGTNALVMADTSGSMTWSDNYPIATSVGLAIYFAERNVGEFHNLFMTFDSNPQIVTLKGATLYQKVNNTLRADWGGSTNLQAAFETVLDIAISNDVTNDEMVKSLIIISDMEINRCTYERDVDTFYDKMKKRYEKAGYDMPNVIFWNVESRHNVFHVQSDYKGVQLASGASPAIFKSVMKNIGTTPYEAMMNTLNSERYDCITIE